MRPISSTKTSEDYGLSKLSSLTINDSNLVSLKASDGNVLRLKNVPMLVDVLVAERSPGLVIGVISWLSCLLASPNLEKFILDLDWRYLRFRWGRKHKRGVNFPLEQLREVELHGYCGRIAEVELVEYLLENAIALQRIVVDPRHQPFCRGVVAARDKPKEQGNARNFAKDQLEKLVPSHVELVIL
ncbi:OLC1v1018238C1 [Oldenlandia corymbosa var. corymbosa]|uniref:OLC1v1018238C1 n=1 Tax=Oldenlandia corymbosa var. corymbosa TaxID=529605 RepID=A0AAV1EBA2_OLDCO|nr:OLC1v1018238C1 [Oldenlandia corymbosa var. corymbosa]